MTEIDLQNLHVCCTAQKLSKIKDFLAFAFAKKQSKMKKAKEQRWLGMSYYFVLYLPFNFHLIVSNFTITFSPNFTSNRHATYAFLNILYEMATADAFNL